MALAFLGRPCLKTMLSKEKHEAIEAEIKKAIEEDLLWNCIKLRGRLDLRIVGSEDIELKFGSWAHDKRSVEVSLFRSDLLVSS